jgi:hypothetical protein
MSDQAFDGTQRVWKLAAVLATAAILVGLAVSSAPAGAQDLAVAAKGKCKKGKHHAVSAKKKCKKKGGATTPTPTPPVNLAPRVRATLTWTGPGDLDLLAWDTNGARGSVETNNIASSSFSADATTAGTETFTDTLSTSNRQFTYGICKDVANATPVTSWSLTFTNSAGASETHTQATEMGFVFTNANSNIRFVYSNPPSFDPGGGTAMGWCPTT